ncbi:MAG: amidohydrolase family protein, partial [Actinobacteria bacterium]|nr:amidohydrolase family protein [Actinomycetota bacterium]
SPPNWQQVSLGRPRPMLEFLFDSTRTASDLVLRGVFARYPDINWVFSHSGAALPVLAERIGLFGAMGPGGVPGDRPVSEQLSGLWYDIAGTPFPHAAPALVRAFGGDRVLYGSDYCWTPAAGVLSQVASVDAAPQPAGDSWRELTTRNAERLIPRLAGGCCGDR